MRHSVHPQGLARQAALALPIAFFLASACQPAPAAADVARTFDERYSAAGLTTLSLEARVGEVRVTGSDVEQIVLRATLDCPEPSAGCREAAKRVKIETRRSGDRLQIEIDGQRERGKEPELALEVEMPARLALELDLGVGQVTATGIAGGVEVDLGVGEVLVDLPETAVARVAVDVGVGEASLTVGGHTLEGSGFLGRSLDWKAGRGPARVSIDVGVGEATVTLE